VPSSSWFISSITEHEISAAPSGISLHDGAVVPFAVCTAWTSLVINAGIQPAFAFPYLQHHSQSYAHNQQRLKDKLSPASILSAVTKLGSFVSMMKNKAINIPSAYHPNMTHFDMIQHVSKLFDELLPNPGSLSCSSKRTPSVPGVAVIHGESIL
jgi:hypothetical protein